ncbi:MULTISPECIES: hypothetical protein [unclassified Nocardia]|nr:MULTISPECIES: hypothetical protein [unclassified Nocardia]
MPDNEIEPEPEQTAPDPTPPRITLSREEIEALRAKLRAKFHEP